MWYAVTSFNSITIYMHRLILDVDKKIYIDHVNRDGLDNRESNLRIATRSQNAMNTNKRNYGSSKYKGVGWSSERGKWRAVICKDGLRKHLGYFSVEEDAASAYDEAAIEWFGEFAAPNFKADHV